MSRVAVYSVPELAINVGADDTYEVSDAWSLLAITTQGATAGAGYVQPLTTDRAVLTIYETQFRLPNIPGNAEAQTPDADVSNLNLQSNDAVSNAMPDFLLRRAAPPVQKPRGNANVIVAEWEGFVTRIDEATIEARLVGLTGEGVAGEVEEATIPRSEIAAADDSLVAVGGLFRLCISYEKTQAGERRRYSTLTFRRLPAYRQRDLDAAHERTRERLNALRVE